MDVTLQRLSCARRRLLPPQDVDEHIVGNDTTVCGDESCQHEPLLRTELDDTVPVDDPQIPQDLHLHEGDRTQRHGSPCGDHMPATASGTGWS